MKSNGVNVNVRVIKGDGSAAPVKRAELEEWKAEVARLVTQSTDVIERRWESEDVRYTRWSGQSKDGRKHKAALDGREAFPFEGASDVRNRSADMVVNERVMILTSAALRAMPKVQGLKSGDRDFGSRMQILLKWVLRNRLAAGFRRELMKLAQYQEGDSPAGAVLGIWWQQEWALEMKTLTLEDLDELLVQTYGLAPEEVQKLAALLYDPAREDEAVRLLIKVVPHLSVKRAGDVVQQLRDTGSAAFPAAYLKHNQPRVDAYRLFENIFFHDTGDLQRAPFILVREWLDEVELRERQVSGDAPGYHADWVKEVLDHKGETGFAINENYNYNVTGDVTGRYNRVGLQAFQDQYEVLTMFFRAVNEDGIPGIHHFTYHHKVDFAANDRQLLDYPHGDYPFIYFGRETLTGRLLDSRGVPELDMTSQAAEKLVIDATNDHLSIATVPPICAPAGRTRRQIPIGPLAIIREDRPGEIHYLQGPQYPQGIDAHREGIRHRRDEYFGRIAESVPPALTQLHQQHMVDSFITSLADALMQLLQLVQFYLGEDELSLITGADGQAIAQSKEEIRGKFRVELSFDARVLNMEYLAELVDLMNKILLMDTMTVAQRDVIVGWLFAALVPDMAADAILTGQGASDREVSDEQLNFAKIAAGIEPPMMKDGQNFGLRLETLQDILAKNPEAGQNLTPMSQEILQARMKHLANQVGQRENAQTGARVGQTVLQ